MGMGNANTVAASSTVASVKSGGSSKDFAAEIAIAIAKVKRLKEQQSLDARRQDTKRKILLGAGLLKAMEKDDGVQQLIMPAVYAELKPDDVAFLKGF
jgi:hypothetical protein